jgi:predicted dehydrogenase
MKKDSINVGLIGYGYWGPNLARVYSELPEASFHTLCDKSPERLKNAKAKHPQLRTCSSAEELLNNPHIDAVLVATPVSTHSRLTEAALQHGKHVYVEKPLCTSYSEAKKLQALALQKKKILMIGHTFLYSPPVQKIKEILKSGTLGRVYYMNSSRVNLGLIQPDVSVFYDLAPHDISIFLHWLEQDPIWVTANGSSHVRKEIFEVGFASMGFPKGVTTHLHVSWLAPSKMRQTTIVGSKRMLVYDDTSPSEKVKIFDHGVVKNPETFGEFQLTYRSGDVLSPHINASEPLRNQAQAFVQAILQSKPPQSDGRFGARVVRVLEAMQKSANAKGKVVRL